MSFVVVVPNQYTWNASHVLENLPYKQLCRLFPREVPTMVKIPKIRLDNKLELNQVLSQMGKVSDGICTEQVRLIELRGLCSLPRKAATLVPKAVPHSLLQIAPKLAQLSSLSSALRFACLAPSVVLRDDAAEKAALTVPHSLSKFFLARKTSQDQLPPCIHLCLLLCQFTERPGHSNRQQRESR